MTFFYIFYQKCNFCSSVCSHNVKSAAQEAWCMHISVIWNGEATSQPSPGFISNIVVSRAKGKQLSLTFDCRLEKAPDKLLLPFQQLYSVPIAIGYITYLSHMLISHGVTAVSLSHQFHPHMLWYIWMLFLKKQYF